MQLGNICIILAGLMALTGMAMGIYMGSAHDFTLAPAHAHLNLLGWVTMAIYGLYHRGTSTGRPGWLRWVQVVAGALGAPAMAGGLAVLLVSPAGSELSGRGEASIIAGSMLALLSMVLFVAIVARDLMWSVSQRSQRTRWSLPDIDPVSS